MDCASQLEECASRIVADGWTVVEDVAPEGLLDRCRNRLAELERTEDYTRTIGQFEMGQRRTCNLIAKGEMFVELAESRMLLELMRRVLGAGCLLNSMMALPLEPGSPEQPLHSDDQAIGLPRDFRRPAICTAIFALTDFTNENGATRIIPGSHRLPRPLRWDEPNRRLDAAVAVEVPAGNALVYSGAIYHGSGANHSGDVRIGLALSYCAGYLRPTENFQLGLPGSTLVKLSDTMLTLCGFDVFAGVVGHVDRRSPRELIDRSGSIMRPASPQTE